MVPLNLTNIFIVYNILSLNISSIYIIYVWVRYITDNDLSGQLAAAEKERECNLIKMYSELKGSLQEALLAWEK